MLTFHTMSTFPSTYNIYCAVTEAKRVPSNFDVPFSLRSSSICSAAPAAAPSPAPPPPAPRQCVDKCLTPDTFVCYGRSSCVASHLSVSCQPRRAVSVVLPRCVSCSGNCEQDAPEDTQHSCNVSFARKCLSVVHVVLSSSRGYDEISSGRRNFVRQKS